MCSEYSIHTCCNALFVVQNFTLWPKNKLYGSPRDIRQPKDILASLRANVIAPLHNLAVERPPPLLEEDGADLPIVFVERIRAPDAETAAHVLHVEHELHRHGRQVTLCALGPDFHRQSQNMKDLTADRWPRQQVENGMVLDGLLQSRGVVVVGEGHG